MNWNVIINNGGDVNHSVQNGALCATINANQSVTLGWSADSSSPLQLAQGTSYQFSYKASASTQLNQFTAKVGHAVQPYDTDFQQDEQVGNNLAPYMHTFMANMPDDQTGIAFILTGPGNGTSNVCIDDVTLVVGN
jgi:hypothetical protein